MKFLDLNKMAHDKICESCIKDKQRPKNVAKKVEFKAKKPGNQVYFDISSIQYKSLGGSKFWLLFVDERTRYKKSYFLSSKSQMAKKGMEYIHFMETYNIKITTFRCNNAGKNIKFKEKLVEIGKKINIKFSAPNNPQQNRIIKRAFATLYGRVQSIMNHAFF